jgi:hypothetical protein
MYQQIVKGILPQGEHRGLSLDAQMFGGIPKLELNRRVAIQIHQLRLACRRRIHPQPKGQEGLDPVATEPQPL